MDYCLSYAAKPNLSFSQTLPSSALLRPIISVAPIRRRSLIVVSCGTEFGGLSAPLEPRTRAGRTVTSALLDDPTNLQFAAEEQLERLAAERDQAAARLHLSLGSDEACLHRRIADLKRHQCQEAVEDVMYTLILNKFLELKVHLIPKLSTCICNSRLEILPSKDWELESIHTAEVLEMVRGHITAVIGLQPNSNIKDFWATTVIRRDKLCKLYAASILYGYFLKSASLRHSLEWGLEPKQSAQCIRAYSPHPVSEIFSPGSKEVMFVTITGPGSTSLSQESYSETLRSYVMRFYPQTIQMCTKPRSKEAARLIERQCFALFGDGKTSLLKDDAICTSFASLKRFVLEGVAFGSFLWETEDNVSDVYMLEEN